VGDRLAVRAPARRDRFGSAACVAIVLLSLLPPDLLLPGRVVRPSPEIRRTVTPLVAPLTEFTQKRPNQAKLTKEIDVASLQPRERIQAPKGAPSTTRQRAPRPAQIPALPTPPPALLPEPPKIEVTNRELPRVDLPPAQSSRHRRSRRWRSPS